MPQQVRQGLILITVAAVVFCTRLGATRLWDDDETYFAQTAREMYERGDLIVPRFNQALFAHKPPFMFWMMIGAYHLLGVTEFAARLPAAIFGIANVLLLWRLGRRLYSPHIGFWAAIILATSLNFIVVARAATCDSELMFFCTLPIYLFVRGTTRSAAGGIETEPHPAWGRSSSELRPSWTMCSLIYAAMGMAVLVKGPIGVLLPTSVLGVFLVCQRALQPDRQTHDLSAWRRALNVALRALAPNTVFRTIREMRPLTAIVAVIAVAGPWYAAVGVKTQGEFLRGFFGVHHFHRFTSSMDNHGASPLYYAVAICIGFFPWIIFLAPSCTEFVRRLRSNHPFRRADVLIAAWFVVWVGFFSLATTKFPHYVVPAYPALALLTATFAERWVREPHIYGKRARRGAWITVATVGIGILAAIPFVSRMHLPGEELLGLAGLPLVAGAAGAAHFTERGQIARALASLTATAVVFAIGLFGVAAVRVDRHQNTPSLAETIHRHGPGAGAHIGTLRYFRPGLVYYCNDRVEQLDQPADAVAFLNGDPGRAFVITTEAEYDELAGKLPPTIGVLERAPWFLKSGKTLVLLGRTGPALAERDSRARE